MAVDGKFPSHGFLMAVGFHGVDWAILGVYLLASTGLGVLLAGKQQTLRDFFLGGRRLPWPAVCGSIVATEVSGVTFVGVAAIVYRDGGNFTYLQLWLGYAIARIAIGYLFVPAFYRRDIYSPYQFMGQRLGPAVDLIATGLFFLGGFLAQGARLYLAALVLDMITGMGLVPGILVMAAVSIAWTCIGGIHTVVWTDVVQLCVMVLGAVAALAVVLARVEGGLAAVIEAGAAADKFRAFDLRTDPSVAFTLWTGLLGASVQGLASHGTDQTMAQRLLCCRGEREARRAIVASAAAVVLPAIMLWVGVGLHAYFGQYPPAPEVRAQLAQRPDRALPTFVLYALPPGLKGLLFSSIFAAAVSTGTSVLSAMSQTALMTVYRPLRGGAAGDREELWASRIFIGITGVILAGAAIVASAVEKYGNILELALAMSTYTYGPILGCFLLALLPFRRDGRGLLWGAPLALLTVLALDWRALAWVRGLVLGSTLLLVGSAWGGLRKEPRAFGIVLAGAAMALGVTFFEGLAGGTASVPRFKIAWPWFFPIGTILTLAFGMAIGRERLAPPERAPLPSNGAS